jgi:hypothetical protein
LARYAPRFRRARDMLTTLFDALGPVKCFSAYMPDSEEIRQAERRRASVVRDAPDSRAAKTFVRLAEELAESAVPHSMPAPTLFFTPGRNLVGDPAPRGIPLIELAPDSYGNAGEVERRSVSAESAGWLRRARETEDPQQALRYAVLALAPEPTNKKALELFELCLAVCIEDAKYADTDRLAGLGHFLADNGFYKYAAQLFRRVTDLDPTYVGGWAGLALTTNDEKERAHAHQMCLRVSGAVYRSKVTERPVRTPERPVGPGAALQPVYPNFKSANA